MCMSARGCGIERPWSRRRLVGRCRSRSPSKHARHRRMVGCSWRRKGPISVSRLLSTTAAPLDCAVCPHRPSMGGVYRPQWVGLRRTHSSRRNEAAQIYKKTGNRDQVQLPLGHTTLESAVRYLGIGWTMPSPSRNRSSYRRARWKGESR